MGSIKQTDSGYKFTSPIRKFKANDPYYYEVDNIPIGELEENDLWLKDQLLNLTIEGVTRRDLDELRPYATGGDSFVRVRPGRFMARINDAYNKGYKRLSSFIFTPDALATVNGYYFGEGGFYGTDGVSGIAFMEKQVQKFKSEISTNYLSLNGLYERILLQTLKNTFLGNNFFADIPSNIDAVLSPSSLETVDDPLLAGYIKNYRGIYTALIPSLTRDTISNYTILAIEFTRRWAGIARTSLVDVPTELAVTVPSFDSADFYYIDEEGNQIPLTNAPNATRIDLVFIYSSPVDASSTTIFDRAGKSIISQAKLGILAGAGVVVNYGTSSQASPLIDATLGPTPTLQGSVDAYMLPNIADSFAGQGGFTNVNGTRIYGSIPSPDDLMNLSPALLNGIEETDYRLIGQSILPVAYVVRQAGSVTVSPEEVIDIRPFFRTAELTYNERSGIAAASPQISLANPVMGKLEFQKHLGVFKDEVIDTVAFPEGNAVAYTGITGESIPNFPRTIGGGYIWGGTQWGPEAAVESHLAGTETENGGWFDAKFESVGLTYGMLPTLPDWDIAVWALGAGSAGQLRNDRINYKWTSNTGNAPLKTGTNESAALDFSDYESGSIRYSAIQPKNYIHTSTKGSSSKKGPNINHQGGWAPYRMYWVSKKIHFAMPPGFGHYDVRATLMNCCPTVDTGNSQNQHEDVDSNGGFGSGLWVEKYDGYFEICVAFGGPDYYYNGGKGPYIGKSTALTYNGPVAGNPNSRSSIYFRAFTVFDSDSVKAPGPMGENFTASYLQNYGPMSNALSERIGTCSYPTVQFEITAYPQIGVPFSATMHNETGSIFDSEGGTVISVA